MGKIKSLEIVLVGDNCTFMAGCQINGSLILVLNQSQRIDRVSVRFRGRAKTSWIKHQGKTSTHYSDQEIYFDHWIDTQYVDTFEAYVVPNGCHRIPFSFSLPERLPSSYEGLYGHIRYDCTAVLSRAWKLDLTCRKPFTVIAVEDLNSILDVGRPLKFSQTQDIHCCCFKRGTVGVNVRLPKRGFVPTELLDASCEIFNNSTKTINLIYVALKQHVTFHGKTVLLSQSGVKQVSKDITQLEWSTAIGPNAANRLNFQIFIPLLPPRMVSCAIIDINYLLKIRIGDWLHCSVPIVLGTIAVETSQSEGASSSNCFWSPSTSNASRALSCSDIRDRPPPYKEETPPPSYEACLLPLDESAPDAFQYDGEQPGPISFIRSLFTCRRW